MLVVTGRYSISKRHHVCGMWVCLLWKRNDMYHASVNIELHDRRTVGTADIFDWGGAKSDLRSVLV